MAFKRITLMNIWEIIRRYHDKQAINHIARVLGYDWKTVNKYIKHAQKQGLDFDEPLPPKETVLALFKNTIPESQRPKPVRNILKPYLDEISDLVNDKEHPVKAKIAFEIICQRHDLNGKVSYSSFKRFIRENKPKISQQKTTCRIEIEAGQEVQIDYAKMGLLYDPVTGKRKTVYAFIATLSHSRHKFIEFVHKQNQQSFTASHIKMFEYFDGVPARILIDNLKSGVIKPNLYDPQLNRTYQEMAEHYGCFVDPCRVRRPQDKGKVERDVQTVRQQFRKLTQLYPTMDIVKANHLVLKWCKEEYGQRKHGTTNLKPYQVFVEYEQKALKSLPLEPFEMSLWKEAVVHPDHYVQFEKKAYSVPDPYCGHVVSVRGTEKRVEIYFDEQLIKQHIITDRYRHTDLSDFPENVKAALDEGIPLRLQEQARHVGHGFEKLVRKTLEPNAFINMRKAQGMVALMKKYDKDILEQAASQALAYNHSLSLKGFKKLLEGQKHKKHTDQTPLSQQSLQFARQGNYFNHAK